MKRGILCSLMLFLVSMDVAMKVFPLWVQQHWLPSNHQSALSNSQHLLVVVTYSLTHTQSVLFKLHIFNSIYFCVFNANYLLDECDFIEGCAFYFTLLIMSAIQFEY